MARAVLGPKLAACHRHATSRSSKFDASIWSAGVYRVCQASPPRYVHSPSLVPGPWATTAIWETTRTPNPSVSQPAFLPIALLLTDSSPSLATGIAPTIRKALGRSRPRLATGASADSWDRSCWHAKNLTNARRCWVTWSRIVHAASIAGLECVENGGLRGLTPTSSSTSPSTYASVRRCGGSTTRIMAASGPQRTARPGDLGRWEPRCLQRRPMRTPARQSCQSTHRTTRVSRRPSRRAAR